MMSNQVPKLDPQNVEDILSLTPLQEGMLFHYVSNPGTPLYFEQLCLSLSGTVDPILFRKAWEVVFQSNEMLRAVFRWEQIDKPVQIVLKKRDLPLLEIDLSETTLAEKPDLLLEVKLKDRQQPLDLTQEPFRLTLCKLDQEHHELIISSHHILYDGWSNGIILKEFFEAYYLLTAGNPVSKHLKPKFKEFIKWLHSRDYETRNTYWKEYLQGFNSKTGLPTDIKKISEISSLTTYTCHLSEDLTRGLDGFLKGQNLTLAILLYSAWGILLQHYNDTDDILFGTTVAGREAPIPGVENTVGLFINTIPLRFNFSQELEVAKVLQMLSRELQQRTTHEMAALTDIKACSELDKQGALFDSLVVIDNYPLQVNLDQSGTGLQVESHAISEMTNFDLTLQVYTFGEIELQFHYNPDLFEADTIQRLAEHYQKILTEIIEQPKRKLLEIDLLATAEKEKLLKEFNRTQVPYPKDQLIHQLIATQARKTPDRIAAAYEDQQITYNELENESNQVAALLQSQGIKPGDMVGLLMPRSIEMVLGMLGILKANAVCVPLDTEHPHERIQTILEDSNTQILLELTGHDFLPAYQGTKLTFNREQLSAYAKIDPSNKISSEQLAYLIYTSGSTGKPKGAMLNHSGIINHVLTKIAVLGITAADIVGNNFSVNVIAAIWQILAPLFCGAKLMIYAEAVEKDPYLQFEKVAGDRVSVIEVIPSVLSAYLNIVENGKNLIPLPHLRKIALTSEETKCFLVNKFYQHYQIQLVDCYGQTECSDDTLHYEIPVSTETTLVPIGKPSHNTRAYILSRHNQLQPIGISGELCISGDGVGQGYWNKPELTAAKFMPNPFEPGQIMYRTGDLARWSPKGYVIYQGRLDHQVKIRGNRIELGEIESQLLTYQAIRETVVVARENEQGECFLAAFLVAAQDITVSELRGYLAKAIPDYMIPAQFIRLEKMPLTPNGKIDRKRLPKNESNIAIGNQFVPPGTIVEKQLALIWQQILHRTDLGIHDNFFDLGGHSLLLIQVKNKIQDVFGQEIPIVEMFHYPTISLLAGYINQKTPRDSFADTNPLPKNGPVMKDQESIAIAIIGMAGYFPGAKNIQEFWNHLLNGQETVSRFQDEELENIEAIKDIMDDPLFVKANGILEGIDCFDADFFGFNPRETELTDPQQRLFLKCAWEALENAGYNPDRYSAKIGVYAGVGMNTYLIQHLLPEQELIRTSGNFQTVIGNDKDFIATRVSYKLNLKGPSLTVQTACSTSLVAAHLAGQALNNGECQIALAGAAFIRLPQKTGYLYQEGGNLAQDGHCRTFDRDAKGTVFGNGVGVVVLKRLASACQDGDRIYAVIKSSAINNDGSQKVSYTAPSIDGQADVITQAIAGAGIDPESIGYVETHGTATALGDPIEISALTKAFRKSTTKKAFCAVGTVKTNIGHLDVAAGIAGLIKTALVLENKKIPPSLHFARPNPVIDFLDSPFYVNDRLMEWEAGTEPRRAGVSCFGIGGTNVHMILEEAPSPQPSVPVRSDYLLVLSARTEEALAMISQNLAVCLQTNPDLNLADVVYTLQVGRREFPHRKALICHDRSEAVQMLEELKFAPVLNGIATPERLNLAFGYDPPSAITWELLRELYWKEPAFQRQFALNCKLLKLRSNLDLVAVLRGEITPEPQFSTESPSRTMIGLVIQYTVLQVLQEWGIQPVVLLGLHESELFAACLAGVFSLEDSLELIAANESRIFDHKIKEIQLHPPRIPFISRRSGTWIQPAEAMDPGYWSGSLKPVLTNSKQIIGFMEPDYILLTTNRESSKIEGRFRQRIAILPSKDESMPHSVWLEFLRRLWLEGAVIDWSGFYGREKRYRVSLPTYPFAEERFWVAPASKFIKMTRNPEMPFSFQPGNVTSGCFYLPLWKQAPLIDAANWREDLTANSVWLIFTDELGVGARLEQELTGARQIVIQVTPGKQFQKINNTSYQINPQTAEHYQLLIRDLTEQGFMMERIIHLWNITYLGVAEVNGYERFQELQYYGFYSLVFTAKALANKDLSGNVKIWAVSDSTQDLTGMEVLVPEKTTILGAAMVINQEYDSIRCSCIDLALADLQTTHPGDLVLRILRECIHNSGDNLIAFRGRQRWTQFYEPVRGCAGQDSKRLPIRPGGVYMITGGLGKIGLKIAEYFASLANIKLILTGRSNFPDHQNWDLWLKSHDPQEEYSRKIETLLRIEAMGTEILTANIDITDFTAMECLITKARSRFGKLNGVIHGAGITGEAAITLISELSPENADRQLLPKVKGLYQLEKLLAGKPLDFCVMLSSVATLLGGLGSATYSAANIFMDSFTRKHNQTGNADFISINWDKWAVEEPETTSKFISDPTALSPAEGVAALGKILSWRLLPQVIVASGDLTLRYRRAFPKQPGMAVEPDELVNATTVHKRPVLTSTYRAARNPVEMVIVGIWEKIIGVSPVGISDNFFELGGHSLLATQVTSRLREIFRIEVSLRQFFESPTVSEMGGEIIRMVGGNETAEKIVQTYLKFIEFTEQKG